MTTPQPKPFAFYGRMSTEDNQSPEPSRSWQLTRTTTLIQPHGGHIVTGCFDVGQSRSLIEGRYLGGRPPYGYTLRDLGSHPDPAKAADGKRLKGLTPDQETAPIARRIFAEFLAGIGLFGIAEGLTAIHVPCPSAHDRARNPHRSGIAWSKSAVRVILTNPRYTGRQVWNKQRTDEVLLDVDDRSPRRSSTSRSSTMRRSSRSKQSCNGADGEPAVSTSSSTPATRTSSAA